ncbi:MAG: MFS transporter [Pseudomonadota bacterium]
MTDRRDAGGLASTGYPVTRARRTLLASIVIIWMGFTVLFPLIAPIGREMGLTEFQITSIIGTSSLVVFLASPVWGRLSDRFGRKRMLLTGILGFAFGTALFNTVLSLGLSGALSGLMLYGSLLLARWMHAGVMSAAMPATTAYMADITSLSERTRGMGAAGAANNLGSIIGPSLAALAVVGLLFPLWLMAGLALLNALLVWRLLPESPAFTAQQGAAPRRPAKRMPYTDRRILPFVVVGVLMFTGAALVQQTMGFRFQDAIGLTATETASVFGVAMMLSAVCSLFAQAVIVQRMHLAPFTLLRLAIPLLIVAFTMMALLDGRWGLTTAMMVQGLGMGLAAPGFMAGASLAVAPEEQGAVAGVAGACPPLGFSIGPLLGGWLYQIEPVLPYACAAGMYVLLFAAMGWIGRRVTVHSYDREAAP